MWHLKTKSGTFWILKNHQNQYQLGCGEESLGRYEQPIEALIDVVNQETGFAKWDERLRVFAPVRLEHWAEGLPSSW